MHGSGVGVCALVLTVAGMMIVVDKYGVATAQRRQICASFAPQLGGNPWAETVACGYFWGRYIGLRS